MKNGALIEQRVRLGHGAHVLLVATAKKGLGATDDPTQSAENESSVDDSTDIAINKEKQIPTS